MFSTPSASSAPRVVMIGVTGYAAFLLKVIRRLQAAGRMRLVAATVINRPEAEETCRELEASGCRIFTDYRAMLQAEAGRTDICIVPTAPHWHAEMTVAALEAGYHVALEKPIAPTLADIAAIQAAERRSGRVVVVGFQDLHTPALRSLRARLAAGEFGPARFASFSCFWPRRAGYYSRNRWAGRLGVDGRDVFDSPISNAMAHFAMLVSHLCAPEGRDATALEVVSADLRRANPIESFDTFAIEGRTAEGVAFRFAGSHACASDRAPEVTIVADRARIHWQQGGRILVEHAAGHNEIIPLPDAETSRVDMFSAFLDRIAGRPAFTCSTDTAAVHARFYIGLHAAHPILDADPARVRSADIGENRLLWIEGVEDELHAWAHASAASLA